MTPLELRLESLRIAAQVLPKEAGIDAIVNSASAVLDFLNGSSGASRPECTPHKDQESERASASDGPQRR